MRATQPDTNADRNQHANTHCDAHPNPYSDPHTHEHADRDRNPDVCRSGSIVYRPDAMCLGILCARGVLQSAVRRSAGGM